MWWLLLEQNPDMYLTPYCARKSYVEQNPEIIQKFTNAIQKGMDYVNSHSAEEIAKTIQPQFKENTGG